MRDGVHVAKVTLAHGGGGKAMRDLIDDVFVAAFDNPPLAPLEDQARFALAISPRHGDRLAFTSDSFVIDPLEFPGGDIGKLAVCGTVNDLAVGGAKPLYLSCSAIIEEGIEVDFLRKIARSMAETAAAAGVAIVTGDTKVVERGACDKLFINTAGDRRRSAPASTLARIAREVGRRRFWSMGFLAIMARPFSCARATCISKRRSRATAPR